MGPDRVRKRKTSGNKMAELARRLRVSPSTVSRALAGHSRISEPTRRRVQEMAASLGYRVDASGRKLRTGLTHTIAVVIPLAHATRQRLSDPYFLEMLGAIADELTARNYNLLLTKTTQPPGEWISSMIAGRHADAAIVIGQSLYHAELNEAAASSGVAMVVWGAQLPGQRYVTVGSDNEQAAETVTAHLISQGCRRIVFLGDPAVPEVQCRLAGYVKALKAAGLPRDSLLEVAVRFGSDAAYDGVSALLGAKAKFDGIFACSDVIAMSAMRALTERGLRIPADVAVAGFDDIPLASYANPPLTTVRQDYLAGARLLVDKVLRALAGESVTSAVIPAELVVRSSSLRRHHQRVSPDSLVATGSARPRRAKTRTLD